MQIQENVPLNSHSAMRLGGNARYLSNINDRFEIAPLIAWAAQNRVPVIMVGDGTNIVWRDEGFPGLVLVNRIKRFETLNVDDDNMYLTVGGGEHWDSVVERTVDMGFSGLEELSLIPGTAGATPVQNVGAYGKEIKDVMMTLEAYDIMQGKLVTLPASECAFGYRTSRFKTTDRGRFLITSVTFHLARTNPAPPFYDSLRLYFADKGITAFTPKVVRDAVIAIRSAKLPDPKVVANNGSFFFNPFVSSEKLSQLLEDFPTLAYSVTSDDKIKVSAAWLVEQAGFKDAHDTETGMATWAKQPLILVNEGAKSTADLLKFKQKITDAVKEKFGITLQQEPELLP